MSDVALKEARRLMPTALGSGSTSQTVSYPCIHLADPQRRTFQEHLISLCSYPSYDCKSFFGTLIAKFFAEFEDLQDGAVDAILDLCEDDAEKVSAGLEGQR